MRWFFTIEGEGTKVAESFEGDPIAAAQLVINIIDSANPEIEQTAFPIDKNSDWAYNSTNDIAPDWMMPSFDASGWAFGPATLGYNDYLIKTEVEENPDVYFRKPFLVENLSAVTSNLTLGIIADDSYEIYLNGVLVSQDDMQTLDGVAELRYLEITVSKDLLTDGENILAVKVTNTEANDLIFDAFLQNQFETFDNNSEFELTYLTSYFTNVFDEGAAEIVSYDPSSFRILFTNADANTVGVLDIQNPEDPQLLFDIELDSYGGGVNSVDVFDGLIAVAVEADVKQDNGVVVFFDINGNFLNQVEVGALPDMITFNSDGTLVMTANEGEPNDDYTVDPVGSISVVDISQGVDNATVTTVDFSAFDGDVDDLRAAGVRIFGPGASLSMDMEPEYLALSTDGSTVFVNCQENNAMGIFDLETMTFSAILPLGFKDHSLDGNGFDASNESSSIDIRTHPTLGMYMPDAIKVVNIAGQDYIVTANEGDARDYDGYSEEERVKGLELDSLAYPNADVLQEDENLGRLLSTTANGDIDGDGDIDQIYSYGTRSFSIWNASTGELVFDSGDDFENVTSRYLPLFFNSSNDNSALKNRSDDKGPEPEAVEIVERGGQVYALVGLERVGGIIVYNITDPANAYYVSYINNRNFEAPVTSNEALDLGVEDIIYIDPQSSPNGEALVVTANEVSGTVSLFGVSDGRLAGDDFTLRIVHNNDGESKLEAEEVAGFLIGGAAPFKTVVDQLRAESTPSVMLSSGDNFLAGVAFTASLNRGDDAPFYDAEVLDALNYDAICIGNHDFDFGPDVLEKMITDFSDTQPPYLGANLDFSNEPGLQALVNEGRIARSTIIDMDGESVGVIGLSPTNLRSISTPRGVEVLQDIQTITQSIVDGMTSNGINKIILITHLQSINNELELASNLTDVDVIIAGGGDELLTNDPSIAIPGLSVTGEYPLTTTDANGENVYLVTTPGEYRYVGNLVVTFDPDGKVQEINEESNPILVADVLPDSTLQAEVVDSVTLFAINLENNIIATTEVDLDGTRAGVRTMETNQGNMIADAFLWLGENSREGFNLDPNLPIVAVQNGGGIRNDEIIPAGSNISEKKTFDMLPFDNKVVIVNALSPQQLKEVMENAVANVENVDGRFAQIAGFSIVYDPNAAPGERIKHLRLNSGISVVENYSIVTGAPDVYVITNSFTAAGGDDYATFEQAGNLAIIGASYQRVLFEYIVAEDGLNGLITAEQYPVGGEGRIQTITTSTETPEFFESELKVYPNPVVDELYLEFNKTISDEIKSVQIFDILGQLVQSINVNSIDRSQLKMNMEDLSTGKYSIRVITDDKLISTEFIKL